MDSNQDNGIFPQRAASLFPQRTVSLNQNNVIFTKREDAFFKNADKLLEKCYEFRSLILKTEALSAYPNITREADRFFTKQLRKLSLLRYRFANADESKYQDFENQLQTFQTDIDVFTLAIFIDINHNVNSSPLLDMAKYALVECEALITYLSENKESNQGVINAYVNIHNKFKSIANNNIEAQLIKAFEIFYSQNRKYNVDFANINKHFHEALQNMKSSLSSKLKAAEESYSHTKHFATVPPTNQQETYLHEDFFTLSKTTETLLKRLENANADKNDWSYENFKAIKRDVDEISKLLEFSMFYNEITDALSEITIKTAKTNYLGNPMTKKTSENFSALEQQLGDIIVELRNLAKQSNSPTASNIETNKETCIETLQKKFNSLNLELNKLCNPNPFERLHSSHKTNLTLVRNSFTSAIFISKSISSRLIDEIRRSKKTIIELRQTKTIDGIGQSNSFYANTCSSNQNPTPRRSSSFNIQTYNKEFSVKTSKH